MSTPRPIQTTAVAAKPSAIQVILAITVSALRYHLRSVLMVPAHVTTYIFAETVKIVLASLERPEPCCALTVRTVTATGAHQTPIALRRLKVSAHRKRAAILGRALIREVSAVIQRRGTFSWLKTLLSDVPLSEINVLMV